MTGRMMSMSDSSTFSIGMVVSVSSPVTTGPSSQIQNGVRPAGEQRRRAFRQVNAKRANPTRSGTSLPLGTVCTRLSQIRTVQWCVGWGWMGGQVVPGNAKPFEIGTMSTCCLTLGAHFGGGEFTWQTSGVIKLRPCRWCGWPVRSPEARGANRNKSTTNPTYRCTLTSLCTHPTLPCPAPPRPSLARLFTILPSPTQAHSKVMGQHPRAQRTHRRQQEW